MEHKESLCKSGQTDSLSLCTNQAQVTSLAEIVKEDYPLSIIRAKNEQGVETLAAHIVSKINYYLNAVDLKHSMNDAQVLLCAKFIIEEHLHLPLKAMDMFFDDAIKGKFGHHYNKMDIPTLMSWLKKFENTYFDMVEEQAYQSHQSTKGDNANFVDILNRNDDAVPMPESLQRMLKLKREETQVEKIRSKVIKDNMHLFSAMSLEDAEKVIEGIVNEQLKKTKLI